jgi:hypothetical protein
MAVPSVTCPAGGRAEIKPALRWLAPSNDVGQLDTAPLRFFLPVGKIRLTPIDIPKGVALVYKGEHWGRTGFARPDQHPGDKPP